ncbi:methylase involved in ubiquinone/menaquinone biosynthesis [Saccharomonospora marina XMU15]|uniref:Methylase involved in ubiquinone/menaquinone biosynthesis n=2 Tax=Saccharomonospora TaxID=1851 RepID=H5X0D6_9PSEU|nr:methylase involved in ubiquinone/menaquinone biosynthesis [Saccharomonospora marina XMU15]
MGWLAELPRADDLTPMAWLCTLVRVKRLLRRADVVPSPNIWYFTDTYEVENRAQDADDVIWARLSEQVCWSGADVVDVGCGDGFHLPRFAATARSVVGVEPHEPLVRRAQRRLARYPTVTVRGGTAQRLPLADASADLVHARTAYFFGPGCDPGLREADRVLRPGGALAIVDLDTRHRPYGDWMLADLPHYDPDVVDAFFARQDFTCLRVETRWRFPDREAMAAVLRIEFSARVAERAVAETLKLNAGAEGDELILPVGYRILVRRKPGGLVRSVSPQGRPSTP